MHTKKSDGQELPKLNVTPILNEKSERTELWYRLEKEQLERLEENKKSASDITTSLQNSIDRHRMRINEALTNEEKKALIQRMKLLMSSHEEQIYKEKHINAKIDAIKTKLYPRPKSGSDNVRLENGYKTPRGYTEEEKQELYKLIDSV